MKAVRPEHQEMPVPPRLIVCERTGGWAVALRRELTGLGVRVWETRTLEDCWNELGHSPASIVVLELAKDIDGVLHHLAMLRRRFPEARASVVADRSMAVYENLMREAGAVDFVASPRLVGRLAQQACRHLAQVPPPQQSMTERVWANLPWPEVAGTHHLP